MIRNHEQFVMGNVTIIQHIINFNYGVVYVNHTIQEMKNLQEDLKEIIHGINNPILIMGDFNTILASEDRINDNPIQDIKVKDFKSFLINTGLDELKTAGKQYTWSNNYVHNRIDRILKNAEWIQKWPYMEGVIMIWLL